MRWPLLVAAFVLVAGCAMPADDAGGDVPATTRETSTPSPSPVATTVTNAPDASPTSAPTLEPGEPQGDDGPHAGVSLSPRDFGEHFASFFEEAAMVGDTVTWAGAWTELANPEGGAVVTSELASQAGLRVGILVTPFAEDGSLHRALDDEGRAAYLSETRAFLEERAVHFLAVGIEIDRMWEKNPEGVDAFAAFWPEVVAMAHDAAPDVPVLPVFQHERTSGFTGGLYGGPESSEPKWDLVERFTPRDAVGFTTYPGLVWREPEDVPDDLYAHVAALDERVYFVEIGWFAEGPEGWASTPQEQARFVERFFALASDVDAQLHVWSWLYDQPNVPEPFGTMGLVTQEGERRPAWSAWRAAVAP